MPYPTQEEVYSMFKLFEEPPTGSATFFNTYVSDDVTFHAVGPPTSSHAAVYNSKDAFMAGGFGKLSKAVQSPGIKFKIPGGIDGVVVDEKRGKAAVRFDTMDTVTHGGAVYEQHLSWHAKFREDGMIGEIWAYLDHGYLEHVLGAELKRLGIE